ncbi:MAG: diguanylate cyclase [Sphaerochaeta sp.]|nr:diguanylate cyclase [Sphaerochaeta sp.]
MISFSILFTTIALCLLGIYALKTTTVSRKQSLTIFAGMLVPTSYSFLKIVMGESFAYLVPISGIFALSALLMLLGIYRYDLFKIAPLAREQVFHSLGDGIVIASAQGKLLEANKAALFMIGPTLSDLGTRIAAEVPQWQELLISGREGAFSFYRFETYYDCSVYAIKTKNGAILGTISLLKDNTEQKRKNDLLQIRAEHDGLTGIYNRQTFIEKVEKRLLKSMQETSFVFFDIDHFKVINDKYGHMVGDQMLQAVVACATKNLVGTDFMGRMGGEEFAIFHVSSSKEETIAWADTLRHQVEETVLTIEGDPVSCTISVGLSFSRTASFDEMYRCADRELYKAKDAGRNCICHTTLD